MTIMRRLAFLFAILGLLAQPVAAQQVLHVVPDGPYFPVGYCQITSLGSAVNLTTANCASGTVPSVATIAVICVETQGIRYRDDGTAPTSSVGMPMPIPIPSGTCFQYAGSMTAIKLIQQTSSATIDVSFYK
jgi:hypothetical protein